MQESSSSMVHYGSSVPINLSAQIVDYLVRKSDLDDLVQIQNLITQQAKQSLSVLFDYPLIIKLMERSYISVTILDRNQNIIGCAVFNDTPQGFRGKMDFKHENLWQKWLMQGFEMKNYPVTARNSLWLVFLFYAKQFQKDEMLIVQRIFQNIYAFQPYLESILFLKRGQVVRHPDGIGSEINAILGQYFQKIPCRNREVLRDIIGVSYQSQIYYSAKAACTQILEIRMARQEDHDDLAEIFNRQSEVLTSQFGQFFIADLIATQNLTRRLTKGTKSQGKAVVGQIRQKAVGLMSISTQIDYKLLSQCYDLQIYDNLVKSNFMQALRDHYEDLETQQKNATNEIQKQKLELLQQQQFKCRIIGQRLTLQQHCIDRYLQIKMQIDNILNSEEIQKTLTKKSVSQMITKWIGGFKLHQPTSLFNQFPNFDIDLETFILSPMEFLIQTLEFFGLPKNYMKGEGHFMDWQKKKAEQRKTAILRRPVNKKKKGKKGRKEERKQDDILTPPKHFDLDPFNKAFTKFIAVDTDSRVIFRGQIEQKKKKVKMIFCDQDAQMINQKTVDLNQLGKYLNEKCGIAVSAPMSQNMASFLQAFGGIEYIQRKIQKQVKQEQQKKLYSKNLPIPHKAKEQTSKKIQVIQKLTNYSEFDKALRQIQNYDRMLFKLGYIKSPRLQKQINNLNQNIEKVPSEVAHAKKRAPNPYRVYVSSSQKSQMPQIPLQAQNAMVINLYCVDQIYQSRGLDFIQYGFNLFPDRDYMILTQPFNVPESALLQNFIQVPKKKNSTFQHSLYIFHKDSLFANQLMIRRSQESDISRAGHLLNNLLNVDLILQHCLQGIKNISSRMVTFSVYCDNELVGLYVLSKNVNLDYYISHFHIQDHIILKQHSRECHSKIIHAILNPLFAKSQRYILKEIMRLMNKTCFYFQVNQKTLLPPIFNQLIFIRARNFPHFLKRKWDFNFDPQDYERHISTKNVIDGQRDPYDQQNSPFSLSMITKKMLSTNKISNNTRIVVVGASDTGISFIESLLLIKDINFTNITLLAPGGLITMHVKQKKDLLKAMNTNYTLQQFKGLMIDARVSVLDAKMIKLDKKKKRILIDKNAYIPFDILVISVGLIDTQLQNEGLFSAGLAASPHYKDKKYIKGVYSIDDPYLYQNFKVDNIKGSNISLLTRKKKPQHITIYGRTPHTISFISGLINRGVNPKQIHYVIPQITRQSKKSFNSNTDRLQYQDSLINDPDPFQDQNVSQIVFELFNHLGINIYDGFNYHTIQVNDQNACQSITFRKKAQNYDQLEERIKEKKLQIQLRQQQQQRNRTLQNEESEDHEEQQQTISPEKEIEILQQAQWKVKATPSRFFITSGLVDIDQEIFHIIHQNGLVYNGRLIVKSNFQTTQNQVFACGKICQFSQRYKNKSIGKSLRLDKYNGRQLGIKLSKHILDMLDLSHLATQNYTVQNLPKLFMPVGLGIYLPNQLVYYQIKKIDWGQPKSVYLKEKEDSLQKKDIAKNNIKDFAGHYMRLIMDHNGLVEKVSYLGNEDVLIPSLMSFVGLSIKYLNKLTSRFENGLIENIPQFLSQNWALCLYHQNFSEFRHYVKNQMLMNTECERVMNRASQHAREGNFLTPAFFQQIKTMVSQQMQNPIKLATLDFITQNRNHLPMYFIPQKKVE